MAHPPHSSSPPPHPPRPLSGVRVLDFTRLLPGPWATTLLIDMGAEVIKVEGPGGGDMVRWMPPMTEAGSATFAQLNRGKRSVVIDLKAKGAAAVVARLAATVDVVVEGFRPGVMERLGMGYDALKAARPDLIYCAISGYGQTGPMRNRAGHDLTYAALAGVLGMSGPHDGAPQIPGVQIADMAGGSLMAAVSILGALFHRERTGEGAFLDVSMAEGALALMPLGLAGPLAGAQGDERGRHPLAGGLVNYDIYETADGRAIALGALEPHFWGAFLKAVGRLDLKGALGETGEAFDTAKAEVRALIKGRTQGDWLELASQHDFCLEAVLTPEEAAAHPMHRQRGMFRAVAPQAGGGEALMTPTPFSRADWQGDESPPVAGPPGLGDHTADILAEAGYDEGEIHALKAEGVVS